MSDQLALTRRGLFKSTLALGMPPASIDRKRVVERHNPVNHALDARAPLSVGNGEFAFTADITGLQTFAEQYEKEIPLCTQSQWGWHSFPMLDGKKESDLRLEMYETFGRKVGYPIASTGQKELYNWLRENPHRLHLGRIGFELRKKDGSPATAADVTGIEQTLKLWTGLLESRFSVEGVEVRVITCVHPKMDAVAVSVESALIEQGRLSVFLDFPYGSPGINAADWKSPAKHKTTVAAKSAKAFEIARSLDADTYAVSAAHSGAQVRASDHRIVVTPAKARRFELTVRFSPKRTGPPPPANTVIAASEKHWASFWISGGAIDLGACTDARAPELERRIVLSQYLTAIQCSGSVPPQETGLTCNSWFGKFHLEMHWWHAAHFPLWGRANLMERSLPWYAGIFESAREKARGQGYAGARWPKMVGPEGRDSPSGIGPLLIWQQPHILSMLELSYRAQPSRALLEKYRGIVHDTAAFMAAYAHFDASRGEYVLGPPVIPAQENHPPRETWNPTFELEYWRYGLGLAQRWRERLGQPREPKWDDIRKRLAKLPVREGVYLAHENCPQTYPERNRDHPSMLGALGVLHGEGVDRDTMRRTLARTRKDWRWDDTWGWDFPMVAMTAARLGDAEGAIDALFTKSPKNTWLKNGHNWQRPGLHLYLPGNGALLIGMAVIATTCGLPKSGWNARTEGLLDLPA